MRKDGLQFPDFVIVGAMKAGTTTLFRDLEANPEVFIPYVKEVARLCRSDEELHGDGLAAYAEFFAPAKPGQVIGEGSTQYTKFPDYVGIPQRARKILGPDLRIIYLVRNPVERIISQHYHHVLSQSATPDIDEEVRSHPRYINWSRYAMQIEKWLEVYDRSQIMIVRFEDFTADRRTWVSRISEFIGVTPRPDLVDQEAVWNRSDGRPLAVSPFWRRVRKNPVYKAVVYPFVSPAVRERLRNLVLPPGPPRPQPPRPETVAYILDELADDVERLRSIMGWKQPLWNLEETREKYGCGSSRSEVEAGAASSRQPTADSHTA